jgi:hypothetical protein
MFLPEDAKEKSHVSSFDSDGNVKSDIVLEVPEHMHPLNLGVFGDGSILIDGYYSIGDDSPERLKGKSYAAMFNPSGQSLRDLAKSFSLEATRPNTSTRFREHLHSRLCGRIPLRFDASGCPGRFIWWRDREASKVCKVRAR